MHPGVFNKISKRNLVTVWLWASLLIFASGCGGGSSADPESTQVESDTTLASESTAQTIAPEPGVSAALPTTGDYECPSADLQNRLSCIDPVWDVDRDRDGVLTEVDNCPYTPNPNQSDLDGDGQGDACIPALGQSLSHLPENGFYHTANNSGIVSGPDFGPGEISNDDATYRVPFTQLGGLPQFEVIDAVVIEHAYPGSRLSRILLSIRNNTDQLHCRVNVSESGFIGEGGQFYKDAGFAIVGSHAVRAEYSRTNLRCVAPGEIVYGIALGPEYGQVERIVVGKITTVSDDYRNVEGHLIPTSYIIDNGNLLIHLHNPSTVTIELNPNIPGHIIFLDESAQPLYHQQGFNYGFQTIQPGESIYARLDDIGNFRGRASSVRVIADFSQ